MTMLETSPAETLETQTQDEDPKEAHIIRAEDELAGLSGQPIEALCGKLWVPTRNPEGLPVCERCTEIREAILSSRNNGINN